MGANLRDALDRFRDGVDDMQVEMVKMEQAGYNPTHMMLSVAILANSALTLYFIPRSILDIMPQEAFFRLNLLLMGCIVGAVFLG